MCSKNIIQGEKNMTMHFRGAALRSTVIALAVSQLFAASAWAGQSEAQRIAELEKKLEKSMVLIQELSSRLAAVEGKADNAATTATTAATTAAPVNAKLVAQDSRIDQLEKTIVQVSDNAAKKHDLGLPLHGFADVGYAHSSNDPDGRKGGFTLGNLDIYLTPEFGDRVKSLVELVFEYGPEGTLATDLERVQFGYTFSDALTLWAGRFHTPYGYWNTAFHHGAQIQTAVTRPRFVSFEDQGGILPAHAVGLLASGGVRMGSGKLQYDAYLANGNSISSGVLDFNAYKDDNSNKLVGGNVRYAFGDSLEGLTAGLHGFTEQIDSKDIGATVSTKVNMFGAFAVLDRDNWEFISEYYRFRNKDDTNGTGTHTSWAGFAQLGYTFADTWTPYVRFEKTSLDQADNYFALQDSGRSYKSQVVGLRYNINQQSALKVEFNQTTVQEPVEQKSNEARMQFAVRF
jgi:hypothetical protein